VALKRRITRAAPRATYTEWWWGPSPTIFRTIPAGYHNFEQVIRPEIDPGPAGAYLWAYEFRFVGGEGGYLGLHTHGGSDGKVAVFSIHESPDGSMARTCQIPFAWDTGRAYRMRVWTDREGSWSGAVRDEQSGRDGFIGSFQVPPTWRRLASWSRTSIEYRGGGLTRCADLRPVRVTFGVPTADEGTVEPQLHQSRVGDGTCEGSSVEDVPGGVRHAIGLPS
jgi:hypothetical protein